MTFEREIGYWSQLAVIYGEKLEECLEGLEWLMSPLLYQLTYTARTVGTNRAIGYRNGLESVHSGWSIWSIWSI